MTRHLLLAGPGRLNQLMDCSTGLDLSGPIHDWLWPAGTVRVSPLSPSLGRAITKPRHARPPRQQKITLSLSRAHAGQEPCRRPDSGAQRSTSRATFGAGWRHQSAPRSGSMRIFDGQLSIRRALIKPFIDLCGAAHIQVTQLSTSRVFAMEADLHAWRSETKGRKFWRHSLLGLHERKEQDIYFVVVGPGPAATARRLF